MGELSAYDWLFVGFLIVGGLDILRTIKIPKYIVYWNWWGRVTIKKAEDIKTETEKIENVDNRKGGQKADVSEIQMEDQEEAKTYEWETEGEWLKNIKYKETNLYGE